MALDGVTLSEQEGFLMGTATGACIATAVNQGTKTDQVLTGLGAKGFPYRVDSTTGAIADSQGNPDGSPHSVVKFATA